MAAENELEFAAHRLRSHVRLRHLVVARSHDAPNNGSGNGCKDIEISLQTIVDFNTFTAVGTVSGDLKGTVEFVGDVTSVAPVTADAMPPTRPTLSFTGEPTFVTKHGSITTRNVGVFQPGPFGVGVEFGTVIAGTGKYAQATGIISFAVASDETGARFSENGRGTICTPAGDGDD